MHLQKVLESDVHERLYSPAPVPYRSLSAQRLSECTVFTDTDFDCRSLTPPSAVASSLPTQSPF
jgi:hypothetical protein